MKVLAIIPARGGSKGIPKKNIYPLDGKPLIAYTCESALKAKLVDRVILSTDSKEINDVAIAYGVESPFLRPNHLAEDNTPAFPVIEYTLNQLKDEGYEADAILLLQPTSPMRTSQHIDEAIQKFQDSKLDTLVSVVEVPHQYNPVSILTPKGDHLENYIQTDKQILRRQDKPKVYARNGPAILINDCKSLLERGTLYPNKVAYYEMDTFSSHDIDNMEDLQIAEMLLRTKREME